MLHHHLTYPLDQELLPFLNLGIVLFLQENPKPDREDVRDMLSGHICRCTGYEQIVRAILQASGQ